MRNWEYLSYTKRERTGIIIIIILLMVIVFMPVFFFNQKPVTENISVEEFNRPLEKENRYYRNKEAAGKENKYVGGGNYDNYDSVQTGRKYARKKYYNNYSHSGKNNGGYSSNKWSGKNYPPRGNSNYSLPYKKTAASVFDINKADTSEFISLPGVGSKLAARIILFREKLGGFYNVDQIREVYGLQDSVFRKISPFLRCDSSNVKKLDINLAEKDVLKQHPYIRWNIANAVITYRDQHGKFNSLIELERINSISGDILKKIMPYLTL